MSSTSLPLSAKRQLHCMAPGTAEKVVEEPGMRHRPVDPPPLALPVGPVRGESTYGSKILSLRTSKMVLRGVGRPVSSAPSPLKPLKCRYATPLCVSLSTATATRGCSTCTTA
eukprot:scaffold578_cov243-Pinguiococcus_pyrenoidosus.AAC.20